MLAIAQTVTVARFGHDIGLLQVGVDAAENKITPLQPTAIASGSSGGDARSGTMTPPGLPPATTLAAAQSTRSGRVVKRKQPITDSLPTDTKLRLAKGNSSIPLQVPRIGPRGLTNSGKINTPSWSNSEIQGFKQMIELHGLGSWEQKAQRMPGRTASALQTFWHRHLDLNFKVRIREIFLSSKSSHNSRSSYLAAPDDTSDEDTSIPSGEVTATPTTMEKTDVNESRKRELNRAREQGRAGDFCSGCGAAGRSTGRHWHRRMGNVPRLQVCTECNDEALLRQLEADSDPENVADRRSCNNCSKQMLAKDLAATCCVKIQDGCGRTVCSYCTIRVFGKDELQRAKSCGSFVGGAGRCVGTYVCPGCRRDRHLRDSGIGRHPPNFIVNNGTKVGGSITMGQLLGPRLQQLIAAAAGTADPPDELQLNPVLHEGLFLSTYILDVERMLALRRLRENNHKRQRQADTANEFSIAASAETEQPALGSEDLCFSCKDGGELLCCDMEGCPKAYHKHCATNVLGSVRKVTGKRRKRFKLSVQLPHAKVDGKSGSIWHCPAHFCAVDGCGAPISFTCCGCPATWCAAHLMEHDRDARALPSPAHSERKDDIATLAPSRILCGVCVGLLGHYPALRATAETSVRPVHHVGGQTPSDISSLKLTNERALNSTDPGSTSASCTDADVMPDGGPETTRVCSKVTSLPRAAVLAAEIMALASSAVSAAAESDDVDEMKPEAGEEGAVHGDTGDRHAREDSPLRDCRTPPRDPVGPVATPPVDICV